MYKILITLLGLMLFMSLPASAQMNLPQNYEYQLRSPTKFTHTVVFTENSSINAPPTALYGVVSGAVWRLNPNLSSLTTGAVKSSFSLPVNSMIRNGKAIQVFIHGTTAANGNTKVVNFKFGSTTVVLLNAASNNKDFYANIEVRRTGLSTQQISVSGYANAALLNGLSVAATESEKAAIVVDVDAPTTTGAADVVIDQFTVIGEAG